jgi:hypothetical protein
LPNVTLYPGDNRLTLRRLIEDGVRVHSVVTDPPYGLVSVQKRFGKEGAAPARTDKNDGSFARLSGGFMGKQWDATGIERDPEFWALIYEILLPGGYVFAFSGSRTGHWQACAMELAGFIMHPMHGWVFGCMDPETECLTRRGWLAYTDLLPTDEVLQWDSESDLLSWTVPQHIHEYDFDGQMIQIKNRHTHQVLTPNHRVYAKIRRHSRHQKPTAYEVIESRMVDSRPGNWQVNLPMASFLEGSLNTDVRLAYLVGWWLTRCVGAQGRQRGLLLSVEARHSGETARRSVGLWSERICQEGKEGRHADEHTFYLSGPLADLLRRDFPERKLTWEMLDWSIEARRALYEGLMDGDGSRNKEGQIAEAFWSKDQERRDVFLALALSIGVRCYEDPVKGVVYVNPKTRTTQVQGKQRADRLPYKGKVWCLTVPTGAFVVRRSGRPFITGNSGFPKAHAADKAIDKALGVKGRLRAGRQCGEAHDPWCRSAPRRLVDQGQRARVSAGELCAGLTRSRCMGRLGLRNPGAEARTRTDLPRPEAFQREDRRCQPVEARRWCCEYRRMQGASQPRSGRIAVAHDAARSAHGRSERSRVGHVEGWGRYAASRSRRRSSPGQSYPRRLIGSCVDVSSQGRCTSARARHRAVFCDQERIQRPRACAWRISWATKALPRASSTSSAPTATRCSTTRRQGSRTATDPVIRLSSPSR